jgi:hypothetical protein
MVLVDYIGIFFTCCNTFGWHILYMYRIFLSQSNAYNLTFFYLTNDLHVLYLYYMLKMEVAGFVFIFLNRKLEIELKLQIVLEHGFFRTLQR